MSDGNVNLDFSQYAKKVHWKEFLENENKELTNVVWFSFFKDSNIVMENPNYDWVEDKNIIERKDLDLFFSKKIEIIEQELIVVEKEHMFKCRNYGNTSIEFNLDEVIDSAINLGKIQGKLSVFKDLKEAKQK